MAADTPTSHTSTVIVDVEDLSLILHDVGLDGFLDELIEELSERIGAFDEEAVSQHIRTGFSYSVPEHGLVEWMPAMLNGEVVAVKTVGYHPENPANRNLPSVLGTTALYSATNGALVGITEATLLTALRTGAASAAVTDRAAIAGPITLGVVGCGAQAVTQIHAISRVRPIERLVVTDVLPEVASSLQARLPEGIASVEVVEPHAFDEHVRSFDVLCLCTSAPMYSGPVVRLVDPQPHLHINAVGADFPGKTELHVEDLRLGVVIPDVVEQCLVEGECQQLQPDEVGPSMADVLAGRTEGLVERLTIFDSTGWSYEDLLVAQRILAHAQRCGVGKKVELHRKPVDPYDTYEIIRPAALRRISRRLHSA